MDDKFFDLDEMMVDYAEMTSFDFSSGRFIATTEEYSQQPYTFKYGNYDLLDMFKSMFTKVTADKA